MEFWLDTVNLEIIQSANKLMPFTGVTTNPSIWAQAGKFNPESVHTLLETQPGPVCLQVVDATHEGMLKEAKEFYSLSQRITIKVPATKEGFECIYSLSKEGIPTLATAVFHPTQALLAAKAGAHYIAPYLSHMSNAGIDAFGALQTMLKLYSNYQIKTKLLVAALRNPEQLIKCAELGVHAVTLKESVLQELFEDHLDTREWVDKFRVDWEKVR